MKKKATGLDVDGRCNNRSAMSAVGVSIGLAFRNQRADVSFALDNTQCCICQDWRWRRSPAQNHVSTDSRYVRQSSMVLAPPAPEGLGRCIL